MDYKGTPVYAQAPPYPQDNFVMPQPPPQYSVSPPIQQPPVARPMNNHPTIVHNVPVGPEPQSMVCPSCHSNVRTIMRYESTTRTHCIALILCLFICWPCVCLPYCMDSCRNGNHYCPNCHAFLGTYES